MVIWGKVRTHHPGECTWMVVMAENYYRLVDLQTDKYNIQMKRRRRARDHQKSLGLHFLEVQLRSLYGASRGHLCKVFGDSLPAAGGRHSDWSLGPGGVVRALKGFLDLVVTGAGTARALCVGGRWSYILHIMSLYRERCTH